MSDKLDGLQFEEIAFEELDAIDGGRAGDSGYSSKNDVRRKYNIGDIVEYRHSRYTGGVTGQGRIVGIKAAQFPKGKGYKLEGWWSCAYVIENGSHTDRVWEDAIITRVR